MASTEPDIGTIRPPTGSVLASSTTISPSPADARLPMSARPLAASTNELEATTGPLPVPGVAPRPPGFSRRIKIRRLPIPGLNTAPSERDRGLPHKSDDPSPHRSDYRTFPNDVVRRISTVPPCPPQLDMSRLDCPGVNRPSLHVQPFLHRRLAFAKPSEDQSEISPETRKAPSHTEWAQRLSLAVSCASIGE